MSTLLLLALLKLILAFDFQKHFLAYKHEIESDLFASAQSEVEEDDFRLDCVLSGLEARAAMDTSVIDMSTNLAVDLARLVIPEDTARKLPSHRMRFSSGLFNTINSQDHQYFGQTTLKLRGAPSIIPRPDDRETVTNFAVMCSNAYVIHSILGDWRNVTDWEQDQADDFGWDGTGLRGYIFANKRKSIIIISFKGTSTLLGGGDTVSEDKYIDNLMFSCCCARVDISWTPVCGCYMGSNRCNQTCLEESVKTSEVSYFEEAKAVVNLVKQRYPRAQLWFTGHSLGGSIAGLMAINFPRTAAVTWEAPGMSLYGQRLGLHSNDRKEQARFPIWNYGIDIDPIFTGTCSGIASSCYLSGYAMESQCRQGQDCMFEIPNRIANINSHRIDWIIENILLRPEKYPLPECRPTLNCTECEDWKFLSGIEDNFEL